MLPVIANSINFVILIGFFAFMLRKPVSGMLRKRSDRVQSQLREAEEELAKALELMHQYEQKIKEISREREDILTEANTHAAETRRRLIAEAEKEAEAVRERASANAAVEWNRAESEMRAIIIESSATAAEKFVTMAINKETHDRLFSDVMADLEVVSWKD